VVKTIFNELYQALNMNKIMKKVEKVGYILREERKCKNCNLIEIGDEYHFFLKCTANHS
jgi:phage FluMu protein Com